jgi:hypothetical protein
MFESERATWARCRSRTVLNKTVLPAISCPVSSCAQPQDKQLIKEALNERRTKYCLVWCDVVQMHIDTIASVIMSQSLEVEGFWKVYHGN